VAVHWLVTEEGDVEVAQLHSSVEVVAVCSQLERRPPPLPRVRSLRATSAP